jgi:hypothetical protein
VIVVLGHLLLRETHAGGEPGGLPAHIAIAAASRGRAVQVVGSAGEDAAGDALLVALARAGVGHVAVLRKAGQATPITPARTEPVGPSDAPIEPLLPDEPTMTDAPASDTHDLEAEDVEMALRYLGEIAVLVVADPVAADVMAVVAAAAGWTDSRLVVVVSHETSELTDLPRDAVAFQAPDSDADGAFASMVGSFAAALDDGADPAAAIRSTVDAKGWTPTPPTDRGTPSRRVARSAQGRPGEHR